MTNNRFIYSILAAFVAGTLLLIFIQYNSSRSIDQLIEGNHLLLNDMKVGNDLRETERNIISVESKIRAAVATNDSAYVEGIDQQIADVDIYLQNLRTLSHDSSTLSDIDSLSKLAHKKLDNKNIMLDSFFQQGKRPDRSVIAPPHAYGAPNEINTLIRRLYAKRKDRLAAVNASITKYGRIARTSGIVLIALVLLSFSGLFWFIIDRIRRQNELIRQRDASERKMQEALQIKENFLANMSHEIRTPLNSIIGFSRLLARQPLSEDAQEFVSSIGKSGENLLTIINDILDLSKIEAGMMRVDPKPFSIRELIHSIETFFQQRLSEKQLSLSSIVEDQVPETLNGDATRLTQILVNLIANALKFTEKGGAKVQITSRPISASKIELHIEIADTGIGIPGDQLGSIFERFSQAESSMTRKYGGTGLGLAIVKELIELQHGQITVESHPGQGTTFRFFIPYEIVENTSAIQTIQTKTKAAMPRMENTCILVADDNKMNQRLMEHLLGGAGIAYTIVDNGRSAIDQLRTKNFHLVLMDIQMPIMDGYTASRLIREELRSAVPIIAMTAHAMPGEREKCLAEGMNEYLSKPIDVDELFAVIDKFIAEDCAPTAQPTAAPVSLQYRFIDIAYLRELSGGDIEYELEMADQFLQILPQQLDQLRSALDNGDNATASRIAHDMKTTVSIMGLSEKLFILLDTLEYPDGDTDTNSIYATLYQIATKALLEAKQFHDGQHHGG